MTRHDFGQISAGSKPVPYWEPTREWDGETCFILCGGPSAAAHDIGRLRGHKLIAVNSSIFTAPWANFLLFGDTRWWDEYERDAELKRILQNDALRVVSCSSIVRHPRVLRMKRLEQGGISHDKAFLKIKYTSTISAQNLAAHLGAKKIVTIGLDGKNGGADGNQTHHHLARPHPWKQKPHSFAKQRKEFMAAAAELKKLGIEAVNASPGSALADIFPIVDFDAAVDEDCRRLAENRSRAQVQDDNVTTASRQCHEQPQQQAG